MPPKPRNPENTELVTNLYCRNGYYSYRNPKTGVEYGIGRDKSEAIDQAIEANKAIQGRGSLLERVKTTGRTLADFEPIYQEILAGRKLAEGTRLGRKSILAKIFSKLGDMQIAPRQEDAVEITRRVADWLRDTYTAKDKKRMARNVKAVLTDIFGEMAAAGWLAVNPIKVIRLETPKVKRQRLTLEDFLEVYKAAEKMPAWVQNSMALAVVSLQRREDIASMGFRQEIDGKLEVIQQKSQGKTRLRIPVTLRLEALGWSIGDVIARCRDNVVSRHLLHHISRQGGTKPGDKISEDKLAESFAECVRLAEIVIQPGKTPPTFHEMRSLGGRLYEQQGYDPQALLGHKQASTTAIYLDNRGIEWIEVAA